VSPVTVGVCVGVAVGDVGGEVGEAVGVVVVQMRSEHSVGAMPSNHCPMQVLSEAQARSLMSVHVAVMY
jgi:hypothetical protein